MADDTQQGNEAEGEKEVKELSDAQLSELEQELRDKEADRKPLVGPVEPIAALLREYQNNTGYTTKIHVLAQEFPLFRRIRRGDGNCGYRAFAFGWLSLIHKESELFQVDEIARCLARNELLDTAGFDKLAYEDFTDATLKRIEQLSSSGIQGLESAMNDAEISNSVVVYLRLICSAWIRTHEEEYAPFLEQPVRDYCANEIEAFGKEADEAIMAALVQAFGIRCRIHYCDAAAGGGEEYDFTPEQSWSESRIDLLYVVGHYEILLHD